MQTTETMIREYAKGSAVTCYGLGGQGLPQRRHHGLIGARKPRIGLGTLSSYKGAGSRASGKRKVCYLVPCCALHLAFISG